jgi:epoxyqueuosine reductase
MEPTGDLKLEAFRSGFELAGVTAIQPPPHLSAYEAWLKKGWQGEMSYLENHLSLKGNPKTLLESARSIIAVGLNYNQPNPVVPEQPRVARYALGRDYHRIIRGKLRKLSAWIETMYPESEHRICVDSAPVMERDFAQLAGLGWFGKNTMLINSHRGSWFFIGILLTSVEFLPDSPSIGGCGTCRACIDACPTGAIKFDDGQWQVDARRCISYLTIEYKGEIDPDLRKRIGDWTFGCDVCQEVCPFNQPRPSQPLRGAITAEPDFLSKRTLLSLRQIAEIDEEAWNEQTCGSAIRRTGIEGLRRNALINLENQEAAAAL